VWVHYGDNQHRMFCIFFSCSKLSDVAVFNFGNCSETFLRTASRVWLLFWGSLS
jgi:hypothetical protein